MKPPVHAVIMGVAGCGKSVVGAQIARLLDLPFVEGDRFHPAANVEKMTHGEPLTDADRADWLEALAQQLRCHPDGALLACSALKKKYRDVLRSAAPRLAFVQLSISAQESGRRVSSRAAHFYPPALVASQFEALEDPAAEPDVLVVDGTLPIDALAAQAARWLGERFGGAA